MFLGRLLCAYAAPRVTLLPYIYSFMLIVEKMEVKPEAKQKRPYANLRVIIVAKSAELYTQFAQIFAGGGLVVFREIMV